MTKILTCIACPRGCRLTIKTDTNVDPPPTEPLIEISGNRCPKGSAYGRQEIICPMRTLTTTIECHSLSDVQERSKILHRLPVKTACEIPLSDMLCIMAKIRAIIAEKPVRCGDTVGSVYTGEGKQVPLIACTGME